MLKEPNVSQRGIWRATGFVAEGLRLGGCSFVGEAKALMVEDCLVIESRVDVQRLAELLGYTGMEERFFFRVPLADDSCWLFLVLSPSRSGHK